MIQKERIIIMCVARYKTESLDLLYNLDNNIVFILYKVRVL